MAAGLPSELWDKIFKDLPLTDVNSMTRVSKAINRVAYPFLYRDLKLLIDPKSPLLHTLIQKPEHAKSVRHLILNFCDNSFKCSIENELRQDIFGQDEMVEKKVYSPCDEVNKITPVIRGMQSLHSLSLCRTVRLPVLDFMKGIGATEFSGLKYFSLDNTWGDDEEEEDDDEKEEDDDEEDDDEDEDEEDEDDEEDDDEDDEEDDEEEDEEEDDEEDDDDEEEEDDHHHDDHRHYTSELPVMDNPLFQLSDLPQSEEIELRGIQFGNPYTKKGDDEPTITDLSKPSITKKFKMVDCDISASDLNVLLSHYTNLISLECSVSLEIDWIQNWFDLPQITEGLLKSQKTLQHLSLQLSLYSSDGVDFDYLPGKYGIRSLLTSLKGFTQLRTLEVEYAVIMGWNTEGSPALSQVLPPNLEKLTFTRLMQDWYRYQWDDFIENGRVGPWLEEYLKSAQCLKKVILHVPENLPYFRLHKRFIPKGIKVIIKVDEED